jgi:thioredoxin-dependent peroxiredoxin
MFKQLFKRFATAMVLIFIGLASMIFFMKSSKPVESRTVATSHKHASSEDHKECAAKVLHTNLPRTLLQNTDKSTVSPSEISERGTVIVIRYLGYSCSHCIEQLLALQKLTDRLKAAKVRVIAFSDDTPDQNAIVIQKYNFDPSVFTFAFDPATSLGRSIGAVYKEDDGTNTELHVALIVRKGRIDFAHFDTKPYADVQGLVRDAASSAL